MAELVATMVVGPLLTMVKEKASSYLLEKYNMMEGMEEQHEILMRKLPAILDIINDAEEAAAHRGGVKAWLEAIKKVAYEANEAFDEFKYEALRRQAKENGHYTDLGFHVIKLFPTHNRVAFRDKMGKKLRRIVQVIEVLMAEMNAFGFHYKQQAPPSKQWRHTDHVIFDPHKIITTSREEDSKNIVDILLGQATNEALTVVPIVGMGGLGKTTLAQLVFNHPEIKKHFELLLWVCVSDTFDVNFLAKTIVEAVPGKKKDNTEGSALGRLKDALSGQRYLLVLDDVWNREGDKWEKLKASLKYGGKGSVVLTTTRDKEVANVMGKVKSYYLRGLKDEFIEEIIIAKAFNSEKEEERPRVLVKMVGEIVKRCCGSPLAATALGSVLRTKNTEEEWKAISRRSNICTEESGILPILKLSYNDLPSHMKQCFAFCALFPKDYEIDVDKLIQLWIANGFIQEQEGVRLETTGEHIFSELASRSFFQDVKQVQIQVQIYPFKRISRIGGCYQRNTCKIHDLMHDVAQSIMEKECVAQTENSIYNVKWLTNTARHLFLSTFHSPHLVLNTSLNETSPAIQTLVCDTFQEMSGSLQHSRKYNSLRALQLRTDVRFPLKPKHLHHLRYLDLSTSKIKALPEDISILYNLQILNLSDCYELKRLPRQMKYMTALRHLYTHCCPKLKSMPGGLSKLALLQTLTCFVAATGSGYSNIRELQDLDIGGELELCQLENVTKEDAKATNLAEKKKIRELTLKWSVGCEDDAEVLEGLQPHDEQLRAIRIDSYGSITFPTWMVLLSNMTEIHFFRCEKVQYLFSPDTPFTFPNLKELTLEDLPELERLCGNSPGLEEENIFPHLEKLFIIKCAKLSSLPGQAAFPNLQNARIQKCPLLKTQVEAPKLAVLDIAGDEEEMFLWVASHMTSLTDLTLGVDIPVADFTLEILGITVTEHSVIASHSLSQVMENREKNKLPLTAMTLTGLVLGVTELCSCFLQLQDLTISKSNALVHWLEKEFQNLVSLRTLEISCCDKLTGYAEAAPLEPSTTSSERSHQLLPSLEPLESLDIFDCLEKIKKNVFQKVGSIFSRRQQQGTSESASSERSHQLLPSLESLTISSCDSLVEVFNVPPSLRKMEIICCEKVESIFGRRQQQRGMSESSDAITEQLLLPCLETLQISICSSFTGVLDLPPSLKQLFISQCDGLRSVESRSGELSLRSLWLSHCKIVSSLPDGPQSYSSLVYLSIFKCPGIKTLPACLQQRLSSITYTNVDARYEGPKLLSPKTWKYAA